MFGGLKSMLRDAGCRCLDCACILVVSGNGGRGDGASKVHLKVHRSMPVKSQWYQLQKSRQPVRYADLDHQCVCQNCTGVNEAIGLVLEDTGKSNHHEV